MASDLTQEQFMFPSWPGTNYVHTLQKPSGRVKAINNAQRCIDYHVHARAQTVHCVPLGSVWGEHCHLLCRTQALPTDGPESTNTHSLSYSYSSSHHSVWWYHTAAAAEKPLEIKEIINKKSCIVKNYSCQIVSQTEVCLIRKWTRCFHWRN